VKQVETREIIVGIATDIDLLHYISRHDAQNHDLSILLFILSLPWIFCFKYIPEDRSKNGNEKKRMIAY
jgi:hypothetical protein